MSAFDSAGESDATSLVLYAIIAVVAFVQLVRMLRSRGCQLVFVAVTARGTAAVYQCRIVDILSSKAAGTVVYGLPTIIMQVRDNDLHTSSSFGMNMSRL